SAQAAHSWKLIERKFLESRHGDTEKTVCFQSRPDDRGCYDRSQYISRSLHSLCGRVSPRIHGTDHARENRTTNRSRSGTLRKGSRFGVVYARSPPCRPL